MPKKTTVSVEDKKQKEFVRFAKKSDVPITDIHKSYLESYSGVDLTVRDGNAKSLMDYSAGSGSIDVVIWLVLAGVDVNLQNDTGRTPLYRAVEKEQIETAVLLLLLGADILLRTAEGKTPLTVPGYTFMKSNIGLLTGLHRESFSLKAKVSAQPDSLLVLSDYPRWTERAPRLIGRIREVSEKTWAVDLTKFYEKYPHPLLKILFTMVYLNEEARGIAAEIVLHKPLEEQKPIVGRQVETRYLLTPSLSMPEIAREKVRQDITPEEHIRLSEVEIIYHAQLRLQFAFYLLVAYYKTRIKLNLTDTHDQEGRGSNELCTRACHSALISDVKEEFRWKEAVAVSSDMRESRSNSEKMDKIHLSPNSFFRTILNRTTVELHTAVNQYDAELEGKTTIGGAKPARQKLFEILQKVSLGDMNPLQGLELFLIALVEQNGLLEKIEQGYVQHSANTSPSSMRKIIHGYIFSEALSILKEDRSHLRRSYVASLLFMSKSDRCFIADCTEEELTKKCEPYFLELQQGMIK